MIRPQYQQLVAAHYKMVWVHSKVDQDWCGDDNRYP